MADSVPVPFSRGERGDQGASMGDQAVLLRDGQTCRSALTGAWDG